MFINYKDSYLKTETVTTYPNFKELKTFVAIPLDEYKALAQKYTKLAQSNYICAVSYSKQGLVHAGSLRLYVPSNTAFKLPYGVEFAYAVVPKDVLKDISLNASLDTYISFNIAFFSVGAELPPYYEPHSMKALPNYHVDRLHAICVGSNTVTKDIGFYNVKVGYFNYTIDTNSSVALHEYICPVDFYF